VAIASCAPASSTRVYEITTKSTSPLNCYLCLDRSSHS
jgi:hypothetical protein